jgi:MFS family permease
VIPTTHTEPIAIDDDTAMARLFPSLTATRVQAATYLFGIALFSIAFLVFLNSSISFIVTDVIGRKHKVGSAVGTLGFADELLALVVCPLWGLLSDRIGVRAVAVLGYLIVGISLVGLVQSNNVFPELLMGRLGFSLGGAACSTMVTAVLPAMVAKRQNEGSDYDSEREHQTERDLSGGAYGRAGRLRGDARSSRNGSICHGPTPSVSSEITITPVRYQSLSRTRPPPEEPSETFKGHAPTSDAGTSQLAGLVGMFTGVGALLALAVFLPLPAYFQSRDATPAHSVQYSFYIVASIAFLVSIGIFFGLRNLPGENGKSVSVLFRSSSSKLDTETNINPGSTRPPYLDLLLTSLRLGATDPTISLAYMGGFVARASSVAISLFIPLFVNAYFVRSGLCTSNPHNLPDIKNECERAYKLAAALSGIAETAALICAPIFGWLGGKVIKGKAEWPLLGASAVGVVGYILFGFLKSPDAFHGQANGGQWAILAVVLIGVSQIGSIVCSLSLLGRGVNSGTESKINVSDMSPAHDNNGGDTTPLLSGSSTTHKRGNVQDRSQLKGSIAGMYSLAGGAGILILTKLGGALFDSWTPGAPFFIMAIFNAMLLVAVLLVSGGSALTRRLGQRDTRNGT